MRTTLILLCALTFGVACRQQSASEEATKNYIKKGDTLTIIANSPLADKIKTTSIARETFTKEIVTAAIVKAIPTQFAQIGPPFSGRVIKSYMHLGQKVAKNAPLFEMSSPDFMAAQKEFFQSKSDHQLALQILNRQKDLIKNGVGTAKDLEEAQNGLEIVVQEYRNNLEAIKTYDVNPENMHLGQYLIIRSPIAGEVIENNLVVGQFLKEDTEPVAIVADLSKIWIVGQVKENEIRNIHKNDEVDIQVSAYPDLALKGKIFHIQEMVNEDTRSVEVLIETANPAMRLKHGMYVTAKFKNQATEKIMLPEKAILQEEESAYVYVQDSKNVYIKRKIKTGGTVHGKVVIEEGINPEEVIVIEGGYYLLNTH